MTSCITYDVMNVDIFPRKFLKIGLNIIRWNFFGQANTNNWISLKYAIYYLFVRFSPLTVMISVQKRMDKILTYDVILWPWHHRNDSCPPEMKSVELHGHFDTHKGHMKAFHPDFKFCHVANSAKKGCSRGFPWKPPMLIVFYAHENPRTTSSVQPWATLRDFVSFVM